MNVRVTSGFWVQAYRIRLAQIPIPVFVTSKGDETAGAVLVKLNTLDGQAQLFQRRYDMNTGERVWDILAEGPENKVDQAISRQKSFDPDIWVIEVEDRHGRHLLDQEGLSG